jgi:oligopeptide/dipeptide ABC transporter ATP-binding protein
MDTSTNALPLLHIKGLTIAFPQGANGWLPAVQDVSLTVNHNQIVGLVGESGSGKSLTGSALLRLVPRPGVIRQGCIHFNGQDLLTLTERQMRPLRGRHIALIPQDPMTSLNPVYTIGTQLSEVMTLHLGISQHDAMRRAETLLDQVRVPSAKSRLHAYPHEFSGGMLQRVMIAMALSCNPSLLIADEPTTALDVTVQAQVLDLLKTVQQDTRMGILLITHDLGVVAETCHQVAVMYGGRVLEHAPVEALFANPQHPYTQGLLNCIPRPGHGALLAIPGQPPQLQHMPPGCAFAPRCPHTQPRCEQAVPDMVPITPDQTARCVLLSEPAYC